MEQAMTRTQIPAANKPPLPILNARGAYDAADLLRYFAEANAAAMMVSEVARHLKVPAHRVIFFNGAEGRKALRTQVGVLTDSPPEAPTYADRVEIKKPEKIPHGKKAGIVRGLLAAGHTAEEIRKAAGLSETKTVYSYAGRLGFRMVNGRGAPK